MTRVAVVGGGIAGLATSLFLSSRGHEPVLVERDADHPTYIADRDFECWRRPGVPQLRQPHVFHALAGRVLRAETPEVATSTLDGLGVAIHYAPQLLANPEPGDEELVTTGMRRVVFEAALRRAVDDDPGVRVVAGTAVEGLLADGEHIPGAPHVIGVRTDRDAIEADLVVDATGRRSPLPGWLAELDGRPPVDRVQDLRFAYHTRWFRAPNGGPPPAWPPSRDLGFGAAIALPADAGFVAFVFALAISDPLRGRLRDPDVFDRLAREFDVQRHYLDAGATAVTDVQLMARLENRSRRLVDAAGPIATGVVAVGDAALYTNPTLGLGASLALAHAQHLADIAEVAGEDPGGFAESFDSWTQQHLGPWFDAQVRSDGARLARVEAALAGTTPAPLDEGERFTTAVHACAGSDPHVARVAARVALLLEPPTALRADPLVQQRVESFLATAGRLSPPPPDISRRRFEDLVGGANTSDPPERD